MSNLTHAVAAPEAPAKTAPHAVSSARSLRVQRQCACGGSCDSCKKKNPKEMLQRKSVPGAPAAQVAAPHASSAPAPHVPAASAPAPAIPQAPASSSAAAPKAAANATAASKAAPSPKAAAPKTPAPPTRTPDKPEASATGTDHPKSASPAITEKKKSGDPVSDLPPLVRRVIDTPGEPLDFATRRNMEARFGHSFQDVRIHTDSLAAESARAVYAHAYTVGEHVVFDAGKYRPQTAEGQHLLAHELAHTIQQHGLQKSGPVASDKSGDYQHLENEAESAARTVMQRAPAAAAPVSTARAAQPRLSRTDSAQPASPGKEAANKEDQDSWIPVKKGSPLGKAGVREIARMKSDTDLVAVQMEDPFEVPRKKGSQALPLWDAQAKAGALQSIMAPGASETKTSAALKQERPDTDDLRDLWLQKVGWKKGATANRMWKAAAKELGYPVNTSTFRPSSKVGTQRCDVDHILELQFGGNNVAQNMQMLDSSPNRSSGALIGSFLRDTAFKVRQALKQEDPTTTKDKTKTTTIRIQFGSVTQSTKADPGETDCKCCKVEAKAKELPVNNEDKGGTKTGTPYPMKSGAFSQCVIAGSEDEIDLLESDLPENKAASTIIPGLLLDTWNAPKNRSGMKSCADGPAEGKESTEDEAKPAATAGKGKPAAKAPSKAGGTVVARIDPDARIMKAVKLKKSDTVELQRDTDGHLAMPAKEPKFGFFVNYLSEGYFTHLAVGDDGSLNGKGQIIPSAPFLPKPIDVEFDKEHFVMSTKVKNPKLPIPGVEITECSIGLQIAPEFKPEGKVGFRVAPGGKQIMHGLLTVTADENGLVVNGDVYASIPGVDEAKGNLTLKNKEWSGGIDIKASDFGGKLKYIKSGEVAVRFSQEQGMSATGKVELAVPGVTDPVIATVHYDRDGWAYRAKARFNPPRIKPVDIELEYAHDHLSGEGSTGFEFHQLTGTIHVRYRDEMFSGDATLAVKTNRAEGSLKVEMHHRPNGDLYFTGEGNISFKVTDDLVASAGVKVDEKEKVIVTGELAFTKPIQLFKGFSGNFTFFTIEEDIPLPPPLSVGGVGLEVYIRGSLSAAYSVGPVVLEDVKATANFQPLEKDPEVELDFTSKLVVPAMGSVSGSIGGGIKLNAYIAYVKGGFDITATATLKGGMQVPFHAHYKEGKITADVGFEASLALILSLALTASVEAKAGVGWLSVTTGKEWTLGSFTYDPGLSLGMSLKNKIRYESPDKFTLPSVDDIEWVKPKLDGKDAVRSTAGASKAGEEHSA